jgi:hypothetical protein
MPSKLIQHLGAKISELMNDEPSKLFEAMSLMGTLELVRSYETKLILSNMDID